MNNNEECQFILNKIANNPHILKLIPYEVILLKLLTLTDYDNIRKLLVENKNIDIPLGYLAKLFNKVNYEFIHLLNINNNYYINDNIYDYIISNNEIIPAILQEFNDLKSEEIFKKNIYSIIKSPEIIMVQYKLLDTEYQLFHYLFAKDDYEKDLNLNSYTLENFDLLNGNSYDIKLVLSDDNKVYYLLNNDLYSYDLNTSEIEEKLKMDITKIKPLLSIYVKQP
jgi:hypothetical protein